MFENCVDILDPEIVVPSSDRVEDLEFWNRLNDWCRNTRPKMGPATYAAFNEAISDIREIPGFPMNDLWRLVGQYCGRVHKSDGKKVNICESHLNDNYRAQWGDSGNAILLCKDIKDVGRGGIVALHTVDETILSLDPDCSTCDSSDLGIVYFSSPPSFDEVTYPALLREFYRPFRF